MGFWAIRVDTSGFSLLLGAIFLWLFSRLAKNIATGVPGGAQNFVEHAPGADDGAPGCTTPVGDGSSSPHGTQRSTHRRAVCPIHRASSLSSERLRRTSTRQSLHP